MAKTAATSCLLPALALSACLPVDGRGTPGQVVVQVSADAHEEQGFVTADGFRVRFEEAFVFMGNVRFDRGPGRDCEPYSGTFYQRILDLRVAGPQTLATLFGLGECRIALELRAPPDDSTEVVTDVRPEVEAALRARADDPFVRDRSVVLRVAGTATRADEALRFEWSFRQAFTFDSCGTVALSAGASQTAGVTLELGTLFRDGPDADTAELRFEPFAAADEGGNGDGTVSLEELLSVPSPDAGSRSLAEWLYLERVPGLLRIGGEAPCFVGRLPD